MHRNHNINISGNEFIHSGQRRYTSSAARMRFRTRTLMASCLFVAMMGSIIHVINITRPQHSFEASSGHIHDGFSAPRNTVAAWDAYTGAHTADTAAFTATHTGVHTTSKSK